MANPIRGVYVRKVRAMPFPMPNGRTIDLSYDLGAMLATSLSTKSSFRKIAALDGADVSPGGGECDRRLEVEVTLSSLEMALTELGVKFGFNPGGAINPGTNVNVDTKLKIGALSMDFHVWDCQGARCTIPVATNVDQNLPELEVEMRANFGVITTAADFMTRTNFGKVFRRVLDTGAERLEKARRPTAGGFQPEAHP